MAIVVRLVTGEWKQGVDGCFEHVSDLEGFCMAVRLRENDNYAKVVRAVKERLALREEDEIELTYQWPQWMMGPEWKRANPIDILDDEDMALFMVIRADLEEVHLRVKVVKASRAKNVNSYRSNLDLGGLSPAELANKYWNSAEARSVWDSALTRMLTRNLTGSNIGHLEVGEGVFRGRGGGPGVLKISDIKERERNRCTSTDNGLGVKKTVNVVPTASPNRKATANEKGKQPVDYDETQADSDFEAWRKNQAAEMWREVCATQITLGIDQVGTAKEPDISRTARVLDFGEGTVRQDDQLYLRLPSQVDINRQPPVVTLSTSDSSFGTPTSMSTDATFSTDELPDTDDMNTSNSLEELGKLATT